MLENQAGERGSECGAGWAGSIRHAAFRRDEGNLDVKNDDRNGRSKRGSKAVRASIRSNVVT